MVLKSLVLDLTEMHLYPPRGRISTFCQIQTDCSVYPQTNIYGRALLHDYKRVWQPVLYLFCDRKVQACFDHVDQIGHSHHNDVFFHRNCQKYSVKIIYTIIDWVCLGIPEWCIVGYSVTCPINLWLCCSWCIFLVDLSQRLGLHSTTGQLQYNIRMTNNTYCCYGLINGLISITKRNELKLPSIKKWMSQF